MEVVFVNERNSLSFCFRQIITMETEIDIPEPTLNHIINNKELKWYSRIEGSKE